MARRRDFAQDQRLLEALERPLAVATGERQWQRLAPAGSTNESSMAAGDGQVVVVWNAGLEAYSLTTGSFTWSYPVTSYTGYGNVVADGWAYAVVDGHVVRLKLTNGSLSWKAAVDAHSATDAPPAFRVRARFAVSVVTCRHAARRSPASGFSRSNRSRISRRTGISRSAHSMRRLPSAARLRSTTSCPGSGWPALDRGAGAAGGLGIAMWFRTTYGRRCGEASRSNRSRASRYDE